MAAETMERARGGPILAVTPERTEELVEHSLRRAYGLGMLAAALTMRNYATLAEAMGRVLDDDPETDVVVVKLARGDAERLVSASRVVLGEGPRSGADDEELAVEASMQRSEAGSPPLDGWTGEGWRERCLRVAGWLEELRAKRAELHDARNDQAADQADAAALRVLLGELLKRSAEQDRPPEDSLRRTAERLGVKL